MICICGPHPQCVYKISEQLARKWVSIYLVYFYYVSHRKPLADVCHLTPPAALGLTHFSERCSQDHREVTRAIFPHHFQCGNTKMIPTEDTHPTHPFCTQQYPSAESLLLNLVMDFIREYTLCQTLLDLRYKMLKFPSCLFLCLSSFSNHSLPLVLLPPFSLFWCFLESERAALLFLCRVYDFPRGSLI